MDAMQLEVSAAAFSEELGKIKAEIGPSFDWYPYDTMGNFSHLRPIFEEHPVESLMAGNRIADIGAADGDAAFFLERLGYDVEVIDHAPTNFNQMRGIRKLAEHLGSSVVVHDIDLDSYFQFPQDNYDLVFFLGILYHLKNPFYVLERLAQVTRHLVVSTRIARRAPNKRKIQDLPVAYLLGPTEANGDSTNFWVFSETGLRRLFDRTGWDLLSLRTVGDTKHSDPARSDRDERAFALLRSRA